MVKALGCALAGIIVSAFQTRRTGSSEARYFRECSWSSHPSQGPRTDNTDAATPLDSWGWGWEVSRSFCPVEANSTSNQSVLMEIFD